MATRRQTRNSRRREAAAQTPTPADESVIDLTCDLESGGSDNDDDVLFVREEPNTLVRPVEDEEPDPQQITARPPTVGLAAAGRPRNEQEAQLDAALRDLADDLQQLERYLELPPAARHRVGGRQALLDRLLFRRQALGEQIPRLRARQRHYLALYRPLSADLDHLLAQLAATIAFRTDTDTDTDSGSEDDRVRSRSPAARPHHQPPASPAAAAASSSSSSDTSGQAGSELQCAVCLESVPCLKVRRVDLLVVRCGHWFCEPCLKATVRQSRQCPICRFRITRPSQYHKLFL